MLLFSRNEKVMEISIEINSIGTLPLLKRFVGGMPYFWFSAISILNMNRSMKEKAVDLYILITLIAMWLYLL